MLDGTPPLLKVQGLEAWYGESHVLHGMDFEIHAGEVVTLLGRNGVGKTSTMRSIMGMVAKRAGSIAYDGTETIKLPSNRIARLGIAYCPEERGIFSSLNVRENLTLPPVVLPGGLSVEEVYGLFPRLQERGSSQGTKLSGGEQQMLAMGRALMSRPRILLLDEPSMGLAPLLVREIFEIIKNINQNGTTILLVEQNASMALSIAHRAYVLENGSIVISGTGEDLAKSGEIQKSYLGGE